MSMSDSMDTRHIHISDYNYPLPDERIAKFPVAQRDQSRLLVYRHGEVCDDRFTALPSYLPEGALMVFNNTKVIQARLHFHKSSGALIEIFLLEPAVPADYEQMFQSRGRCSWYCMVGNLKKWKEGALTRSLTINHVPLTIKATRKGVHGTSHLIEFEWDYSDLSSLTQHPTPITQHPTPITQHPILPNPRCHLLVAQPAVAYQGASLWHWRAGLQS